MADDAAAPGSRWVPRHHRWLPTARVTPTHLLLLLTSHALCCRPHRAAGGWCSAGPAPGQPDPQGLGPSDLCTPHRGEANKLSHCKRSDATCTTHDHSFSNLPCCRMSHTHIQVKHLLPKPRIFGRTVPICQLDVDGVRIEISSMHTRAPIRVAAAAAGDAAVTGVPPDASQILQAGPKAAVVAAAAAAAAAGGQVGRCWLHTPSRLCKVAGSCTQ